MALPFDHITTVDSLLTRSVIGQLQRKQVWRYLEKITPQLTGLEILELNCGTNEDAMLFSEKGFNIIATDVSEEMLKVTVQRANQFSMQNKISSQYLDLDTFDETVFDKKFDLVFSNFGGLNCINPESLQRLLRKIPSILAPGGRFIAIVMPKLCLWETSCRMAKFRFKKAFRRWTSNEVLTDFQGTKIRAWYYSPRQIKNWSKKKFKVVRTVPIGFAIPPTCFEHYFSKRKRFLLQFNRIEKKIDRLGFLAGMSDNYLIDLQLT